MMNEHKRRNADSQTEQGAILHLLDKTMFCALGQICVIWWRCFFCIFDGSDVGCKIEIQVKSDAQIQDCFGGFGESSVAIDSNVNISCKC